ncbi:hypothetical protein NKH18_38900 [Streptomyces sp. M10(2022)]
MFLDAVADSMIRTPGADTVLGPSRTPGPDGGAVPGGVGMGG